MNETRQSSALILGVGSARGLGAAAARAFASAGYRVVIAGRDSEKLQQAAQSVAAVGPAPQVEIGDVTRAEDVARFVASAEALGPLSLAVHNAGGNRPSPFLQVDPKVFEEHWRAHALGAFLLAQAALPRMLERQTGTLIFTGATASLRGRANFASFSAAKAALRMVAQSLAREFGPKGIHVAHVIVDGVIDGERARAFMANADERFGPDGMLHPDRIAEAYLLLHRQQRSAWTQELDLRPWSEGF
ncbi:MAG TPA: SDR family NAD(P)-dependent oxidoreductase [Steroidobacteraceae bacterium]|jgi:NAD(P)-dependent dehydrogenase (short-subunit alcohol dehydrogenase family)|nr:SDR family NAD(P)-dependent oxidoreductase [Steroidobacteraceae bacterium]